MRILVVSNLYPPASHGGYERRCADTVDGLSGRHELLVLTATRGRQPGAADPRVRRELRLLEHRPRDSLLAPLATREAVRAMRRALADLRPQLVFFWNLGEVSRAPVWVAHQARVPLAFHIADPWLPGLYDGDRFMRYLTGDTSGRRRVWAWLLGAVNRLPELRIDPRAPLTAAVSWNSEATRSVAPAPAVMQVHHEAVIYPATHRYARFARAARRPAPATPVIAFAGRLEPQKGPDVAIRALAHLEREHGIGAELELAGAGTSAYRRTLDRLARDLGVADRVRFLGSLDLVEVVALVERASALVTPSVWAEPFGMINVEAAAAGLPVVASLSGGMPEALRPGREALYFPIGDVAACAQALAATLTDPSATADRVRRARDRAREFSFDSYMKRMDCFVEAAADRMPARVGGA